MYFGKGFLKFCINIRPCQDFGNYLFGHLSLYNSCKIYFVSWNICSWRVLHWVRYFYCKSLKANKSLLFITTNVTRIKLQSLDRWSTNFRDSDKYSKWIFSTMKNCTKSKQIIKRKNMKLYTIKYKNNKLRLVSLMLG